MGAILKNGVVYGGSVAQQQANWTESNPSSTSYIQNKPTLGTASSKDSTTTISDGGTDLPTAGAVYTALQNVHIDVDTTLDTTSDNPIANSAVATALNGKVDAVNGKGLSTNDYTDADQSKLSNIAAGAEVNVQSNWNESDNNSDAYIQNKPTALSAFTNDSGFITNTVNNLTNYYTTSTTYTKTEVDNLISAAKNGRFEVVAILPTTDIQTNVIYLLPKTVSQTDNIYDEYINTDGTSAGWEKIGDTQMDLTNYVQKSQTAGLIKNDGTIDTTTYISDISGKADKVSGATNGNFAGLDSNGNLIDSGYSTNDIPSTATDISFDNANTDFESTNVQDAIKEAATMNSGSSSNLKFTKISDEEAMITAPMPDDQQPDTLSKITFNGYNNLSGGLYIWTDGENTYYSYNGTNKVFDKSTLTWSDKTWNGLSSFSGNHVWTDGENIYYSDQTTQKVLDKATSTWSDKTWNGMTNFYGGYIWKDGDNIYYWSGDTQKILDKATSTWSNKTFFGFGSSELPYTSGIYVWTDGDNIYFSYDTPVGNLQKVLNKSTNYWVDKTWYGYQSLNGRNVYTDGKNVYYISSSVRKVLNKATSTWSDKIWYGAPTGFYGEYIWTDGNNTYHSSSSQNFKIITDIEFKFPSTDGAVKQDNDTIIKKNDQTIIGTGFEVISNNEVLLKKLFDGIISKTWNGLSTISGNCIWTDGENIYYSNASTQKVLNKSTSTWSDKTWNGLTSFAGSYIWTDGENIYYSSTSTQKVLNKSTSTWSDKTWSGMTSFNAIDIWTDGENIYYSHETTHKVLDKLTSTWSDKTWIDFTSSVNTSGRYFWTDGENTYYSLSSTQKILDKATSTWSNKTWSGLTSFSGDYIWTDGNNIYYLNNNKQYILNKSTSAWSAKTLFDVSSLTGNYVWTDGNNMYYSDSEHGNYQIVSQETFNINKETLKLATSGTTATGEIRFGVDGSGNYGYIKAGADTVTPFKTGEVTVIKTITTISTSSTSSLSGCKKGDIIVINVGSSTLPTISNVTYTTLVTGLYSRSSAYGSCSIYILTQDAESTAKISNPSSSYTARYCVLRIS